MRAKRIYIEPDENNVKKITAELEDEFHLMILRVWVEDAQLRIVKIDLDMLHYPEPRCIDFREKLQKVVGLNLQHPQFRRRLLKIIGGERGCFHVLELLLEAQDYSRALLWDHWPDKNGRYTITSVNHEDKIRCIAFRKS